MNTQNVFAVHLDGRVVDCFKAADANEAYEKADKVWSKEIKRRKKRSGSVDYYVKLAPKQTILRPTLREVKEYGSVAE